MDLKSLTDDVLYETYRTEKLSRMVHADNTDDSILPEDLATQSVRLKEEQLRREEEKVSPSCIPKMHRSLFTHAPF
jgi:cell division control protein 11